MKIIAWVLSKNGKPQFTVFAQGVLSDFDVAAHWRAAGFDLEPLVYMQSKARYPTHDPAERARLYELVKDNMVTSHAEGCGWRADDAGEMYGCTCGLTDARQALDQIYECNPVLPASVVVSRGVQYASGMYEVLDEDTMDLKLAASPRPMELLLIHARAVEVEL